MGNVNHERSRPDPAEIPAIFLGLECAIAKQSVTPNGIPKLLMLTAGKFVVSRVPTFNVGHDRVTTTEWTCPPDGIRWDKAAFSH